MSDLQELARVIRNAPAVQAKRELALVRRIGAHVDGDDGAAIAHGEEFLILCGEAIAPAFVSADPHAAGAAAVVTNVSDVRAMGGRPVGIVDMLVSPDRAHAEAVLDGVVWAAGLLGVDVVGGHLTLGQAPALSASCTGVASRPLFGRNARPGDELMAAFCLTGQYREGTTFFSSLRDRDAHALREDGEALVELAESGSAHAARDVSMPGVAGSLLQLLETAGCGATLEVERVPRPPGVPLERWLLTFPSFGFLVAAPPERAAEAAESFLRRGLACAPCGRLDDTGVLRLSASGESTELWDLRRVPFTQLRGP
ncbi:MAG TPA: AIR synthase related protein [Solirubrobacteraceae bacterium]|nr:AIR synthase related protein [Solirubrobacteraceae bacterium]